MAQLNINTNACVVFSNKLEQLHRSALPVAVRQTLNAAAFDVKNITLEKSANNNFTRRTPNFFKTFSKVNKATGFDMRNMKAEVGMSDNGKAGVKTAIENMQKQETGGTVNKGASYLADARAGGNSKKVAKRNYFKNNRMLTGTSKQRSSKSAFIANAFAAKKHKAKFSVKTNTGRFLIEVKSIKKDKSGNISIKSKVLMRDRKSKPAKIKATHFVSEAAGMTSRKIESFYAKEANKQFDRLLK